MDERFDVLVVAVDDPAHLRSLAHDLSTFSGVSPDRVELALQRGEFVVYRGLCAQDAERSASALRTFGVTVDVRPSEVSLEMVIEPDPEPPATGRSSTRIRAVSPSGTHRAAGSHAAGVVAAGASSSRLSQGSGAQQAAEWLVDALEAVEASGDAFRITTLDGVAAAEPESRPPSAPEEAAAGVKTARSGAAVPDMTTGRSAAAESGTRRAEGGATASGVSTAQGGAVTRSNPAAAVVAPHGHGEARPPVTQSVPAGQGVKDTASSEAAVGEDNLFSPGADERIELDRDSIRVPPFVSMSAGRSGAERSAAGLSMASPTSGEPAPFLFDRDMWTSMMFGLAIGGAVGLLVARLLIPSADVRQRVFDLELELERAYQSPLDVQIGELRSPSAIELDIDVLAQRARMLSLLVMWAVGAPLGVLLGRMRRRAA